jgi:AraC-like DNA-binding protein
MPSSSVRTFTDPDEYAAASAVSNRQIIVTGRGKFVAKHAFVNFQSLLLQHFSNNLPTVVRFDLSGKHAIVAFQTRPGLNLVKAGIEVDFRSVDRLRFDGAYTQRSASESYGNVALPLEKMASLGGVIERDLASLRDGLIVTPTPSAIARLRRLNSAAVDLAEDAPTVLAHPDAARGLEQALIEAMMRCFESGEAHEDTAAQRQHALIMRRFHRVVEEHLEEPLYIPELCKEVGASERTLNTCCHEHLGMGPKHYLLLRRMHMVRRALRDANPAEKTVTEIAMRHGFWQLGRFAVEYKRLFGEAPSLTLGGSRLATLPSLQR